MRTACHHVVPSRNSEKLMAAFAFHFSAPHFSALDCRFRNKKTHGQKDEGQKDEIRIGWRHSFARSVFCQDGNML
ncbi:hypothetical protein SH501x_001888 [Pirellulaceae bacterium SH501]